MVGLRIARVRGRVPRRMRSGGVRLFRVARNLKLSKVGRRNKKGYFKLVRKGNLQQIANSGTANVAVTTGGTFSLGTPIASGFGGYYHVPFSCAFNLSQLINASDVTNLFDKYRIKWIKLKFYCMSNTASAASTAQLPSLTWIQDDDDVTVPASFNEMREKMGVKQTMFRSGKPITVFIRSPKVIAPLDTTGGSGTWSGNEISRSPWINCTYNTVPHLGFKGMVLDMNLNTTATVYSQITCDITYCIEFKDAQ